MAPTPPEPEVFIGCPKTVDGFVRTLELWRQISYLSEPDSQSQDYHFNIETKKDSTTPSQSESNPPRTRSIGILQPPGAQSVFFVAHRRTPVTGANLLCL
ncbi:hypothetical protein B0H16DRAFT_1718192 [Mycena metata]|uniref:Uncharacterized protein n=1 Tax=Mycena metata TaxID=1033252 RepID=A0AAD7JIW5_9AGAR|nr:hypothetical protein B0H16DRAFT_1718192 [Mycena metata]